MFSNTRINTMSLIFGLFNLFYNKIEYNKTKFLKGLNKLKRLEQDYKYIRINKNILYIQSIKEFKSLF